MNLSELKNNLGLVDELLFKLPDGSMVPKHFHVTEVGHLTKNFIDCGGTVRTEERIGLQLWSATDVDHRLQTEKLLKIIQLSESILELKDQEIEVEYQAETIGKYGLDFDGRHFLLIKKHTDCLALADCGIPKIKENMASLSTTTACCEPGGGCC